jgi:phosphomannomutase
MMYEVVSTQGLDGGVIVTASHNPKEYNGFKIVGRAAQPVAGPELLRIRDIALGGQFARGDGTAEYRDQTEQYLGHICSAVQLGRPLRIVVDTGNGVTGRFAPSLFRRLGCNVTELHCELDGTFPNHAPNPEHEANVRDLMALVVRHPSVEGSTGNRACLGA